MRLLKSAYYYRPSRKSLNLTDEYLVELIENIHDEFPGYGYRRITRALRNMGHHVNHKRIARIMRENGLSVRQKQHYKQIVKSDNTLSVFPNLYKNIIPTKPNLVWVADITYIRLGRGLVFLAAVLDSCSRKVVVTHYRSALIRI